MGNTRYELKAGNEETIPAKLLYVTSAKYEGDWPSIQHSHYFTELFYVKNGQGEFLVDEERFPIGKDDFVIINPNVAHTETSLSTNPLDYVILGVEGVHFTFAKEQEYSIFNCNNKKDHLMFYFTSMLQEIDEKQENYELVCKDLLEVLIIHLIRHNHFTFDIAKPTRATQECSKMKRYIDANIAEELTLDLLAEKVHLNKFYMVHAFTETYGISPMNYLIQKRLENCRELLTSTDHSIAEVARLSGFSSQSYFSQCFRKHCGMSAGVFRKRMKKE